MTVGVLAAVDRALSGRGRQAALALLVGLAALVFPVGCHVHCGWSGPVVAWVDEDLDGSWDEGEPPLEGVEFYVDELVSGWVKAGSRATSDWNGQATVSIDLGTYCNPRLEVYTGPPPGYRVVTAERIQPTLSGDGNSEALAFGFERLAGFPTPTPHVPKLTCRVFDQRANDLAVAPDGTLWALTWNGVASFEPGGSEWTLIREPRDIGYLQDVLVDLSGNPWVSERGGFRRARWSGSEWMVYEGVDVLVADAIPSFGATPDGKIWYAPWDDLVSYDPNTGEWVLYAGGYGPFGPEPAVRQLTDGSVWLAAFNRQSGSDPPAPSDPLGWTVHDVHRFAGAEIRTAPIGGMIEDAAIDKNGNVWIVHRLGVARFDPTRQEWHTAESMPGDPRRFEPRGIAMAPDGSAWITAVDGHSLAFRLEGAADDFDAITWHRFDPRDGIPDAREMDGAHKIDAVAVTPDGAVWFGFGIGKPKQTARCTLLGE